MITIGEHKFFDKIKNDCKVIFDVGARDDVNYLKDSDNKEFHLFEPNSKFYDNLLNNLKPYLSLHNVISNNFGIGSEDSDLVYYHNTQSFTKLVTNYRSDPSNTSVFKVRDFKKYVTDNNIEAIDFLKIDTEGFELDVLYSDIDYIKKYVKFIQFEYTSAWLSKTPVKLLTDVYADLSGDFDFYLLKDDAHPIYKKYSGDMIPVNVSMIGEIDSFMKEGYGYNLGLIKK